MEKSPSAPAFAGAGGGQTPFVAGENMDEFSEVQKDPKKKYNIKQYKGLINSIGDVKNSIEDERRKARERELALRARMKQGESEASVVQKELSVQLRCAGRSYQQLLGATRDLSEQLRVEEDRRVTEIEALEKQIRDLKSKGKESNQPWKDEVAKRDLKIIKLQEAATDQEARLRKAEAAVGPIQLQMEAEIKARDEKFELVVQEIGCMKSEYEQQLEAKDEIFEREVKRAKLEKGELLIKIQDIEEASARISGPYEKQIKELETKVLGLEAQLEKVDYAPLEEKLRMRELGYQKLTKDFRIKQQLNYENIDRMRAGFELTLERMDKQIQENEAHHKKRLKPWCELVEKRESEIVILKARIEELIEQEKVARKQEAEILAEVREELEVVKKAEQIARNEAMQFKKEAAEMEASRQKDTSHRKIQLLQMQLEEVVKRCESTVRQKDRELKQKTDIITELQKKLLEEATHREEDDQVWDTKIQKKEKGYGIICADLAFAEGQILEERKRTEEARETCRKRDRSIERLNKEHGEELRVRVSDHKALRQRVRRLEAEAEDIEARVEEERIVLRKEYEEKFDFVRRRYEDQVSDLRVEMARRDRQRDAVEKELSGVRAEYEKAREDWEEKQRELDILIRGRDRQIVALKNEIEFINDSWEIKYNRLMGLFEKLQKKYEQSFGPNGPQEAYRRARDLKIELEKLRREILELKEMVKKKERLIRTLRRDYDILLQETADTIAIKERGMAELIGDMAKLEARLRNEIDLKERLIKEMNAEKIAIVASFDGRIRQLEQQVEAMKFTDRQELLDTIDIWKRAYERACIERDEVEDQYKELLDMKDKQVQKMAHEYAEVKAEVENETAKGQEALEECEMMWKKLQAQWRVKEIDLNGEILKWKELLDEKTRALDREMGMAAAQVPQDDPEIDIIRKELEEEKAKVVQIERGIGVIVQENAKLRDDAAVVEEKMEQEQANWEPQIRWRDERYAAMVKEHEAIKKILTLEMLKAQETCKIIEEQVKKFPNPFEMELKEAEDKYAQSQAGLMKLSHANASLKNDLADVQDDRDKMEKQYDEQLALAASILREVATLGALKYLSKEQIGELEEALGVDLDGDGKAGR